VLLENELKKKLLASFLAEQNKLVEDYFVVLDFYARNAKGFVFFLLLELF
jgi:hypothetical protein